MNRARHHHNRFFYRYGTVSVPVTALGVVVAGILFLVTDQGFNSASYRSAFRLIDRPTWAFLFIATGLLALVVLHWAATLPLMAVVGMWAATWLLASFDGVVPFHAPIPWTIITLTLTAAVARRGARG